MRNNKIKHKMSAGERAFGFNLSYASPNEIELLGGMGFDYVFVDLEYASHSLDTVVDICRAADVGDLTPICKVPGLEERAIQGYLDAGLMGIHSPHIRTREDAQRLVEACRFPPEGNRGITRSRARRLCADMTAKEYMAWCNREVLTVAYLEDLEALDNLDEILTVEGLDLLRYGINDISMALGHAGDTTHPHVVETLARATERVHAAGKKTFYDVSYYIDTDRVLRNAATEFIRKANEGQDLGMAWIKR